MDLYPAIDLLGGKAVRLREGRYDAVTVYDDDPVRRARAFREHARRLHVVDLEGARSGAPVQRDLVRAIVAEFGAGVQVGGGVRSAEIAEEYLALGVDRVVLGTRAADRPEMVRALAARHPERVVVALDAKDGLVATDGWERTSTLRAVDLARELADAPIAAILYTDIARDGTQVGPNVAATAALAAEPRLAARGIGVLASGGVGTLAHLATLARTPGVVGAIVGRALYEGAFTLEQAAAAARAG